MKGLDKLALEEKNQAKEALIELKNTNNVYLPVRAFPLCTAVGVEQFREEKGE